MNRFNIRAMVRRDLPEVLAIDAHGYAERLSEKELLVLLGGRRTIGYVATHGDIVAGFMIFELMARRILVLRFAVDPGFLRCGVGSAMVEKLTDKLSPPRRGVAQATVRDDDLGAHLFLRRTGWRATAVLRGWFGSGVDGYVFMLAPDAARLATAAREGKAEVDG